MELSDNTDDALSRRRHVPRRSRHTMVTRSLIALLAAQAVMASVGSLRPSPAASPDPLLRRLQAKIDRMKTLRGRFVQMLGSRGMGHERVESGLFALKKPSFMRWEYREPENKLAIMDGEHTWLYLPEDHEVHRGSMPAKTDMSAVMMLTGRIRLERDFTARRLSEREAGPEGMAGAVVIELTPVTPTEEFERIILTIDPGALQIRRLTLIDSLGGRMTFKFLDLVENPRLGDDMFRFEPPPGVSVIDDE